MMQIVDFVQTFKNIDQNYEVNYLRWNETAKAGSEQSPAFNSFISQPKLQTTTKQVLIFPYQIWLGLKSKR